MAAPVPKNIERTRLYTDLMYRFQYVSGFMDFGGTDIAAIRASAKIIAPLVPAVVDAGTRQVERPCAF
jgi:Protoglobin